MLEVWGESLGPHYPCSLQVYVQYRLYSSSVYRLYSSTGIITWYCLAPTNPAPTNTLGNSAFFKILAPPVQAVRCTGWQFCKIERRGWCFKTCQGFVKLGLELSWGALVPGTGEKTKITMQRWASHNSNCQGQWGKEIIVSHLLLCQIMRSYNSEPCNRAGLEMSTEESVKEPARPWRHRDMWASGP